MRVVLTGAGAVCSVGSGVGEIFRELCAGTSGRSELKVFDRTRYRSPYAYEMADRSGREDVPMRATRWLTVAIEQALDQAGIGDDLSGVPVLIGTGLRELRSLELRHVAGADFSVADLDFGPALQARFGAVHTYTFANACAASLSALGLATDLLTAGDADTVVVAGVDMITESMFGLVERIHPVAPEAVRPFDRARTGVLMGEGACAVVLRRDDTGDGAGLAVVRGVGINCDAHHVTAPSPEGMAAAMRQAHDRAGLKPAEVDLVMLHGTGTLLNDDAEAAALGAVFDPAADAPLMTAIKSMTGHTSGASGLLGLITAVQSLRTGRVPPTLGLTSPVEAASSFRIVTGVQARHELATAQVNAFGFGGVNAVAIVEAMS